MTVHTGGFADQPDLAAPAVYHALRPKPPLTKWASSRQHRHTDVFCTDEHVFITTLRSNGHNVVHATDVFVKEPTTQLLRYCDEEDCILITDQERV